MIREIILDTETTGLDPAKGDRIVEIGALELLNHVPTGKIYHVYINPERDVPREAEAVHGLSTQFLKDKPVFRAIADDFLAFIADSALVIHNASFDVGFLNAELTYVKKPLITSERVVDTLMIARQKHPGAANSLDALCRRYGVDNTRRTKHGALLDSELLAEVYIELTGGRQSALVLEATTRSVKPVFQDRTGVLARPAVLPGRLTDEERRAHQDFVANLGELALWKEFQN